MSDEDKRKAKLQDMESKIAAYDAVVRTGNEYLDTVLTEKKLTCQSNQISMSCIADGSQLAFMDELGLYTLFGNALIMRSRQTGKFQTYMNAGYLCRYRTKKESFWWRL